VVELAVVRAASLGTALQNSAVASQGHREDGDLLFYRDPAIVFVEVVAEGILDPSQYDKFFV
jgi:hypothetical protein